VGSGKGRVGSRPFWFAPRPSDATLAPLLRFTSTIRLILGFGFVATTATVWLLAALPLLPWRVLRIKLCNYYGKLVGYTLTRLSGARLEVSGKQRIEDAFPAIYVANHTSTLDAFLSIWLCPVGGCGVVKKQVARIPFFGQLYQLSGHLMIDRGHHGKAVAALEHVGSLVRKHRLGIWIMPEGTRSRDGRLQAFKTGFVHLAIATGLPVVPCGSRCSMRSAPTIGRRKPRKRTRSRCMT
jgi:1-acyl-sn-glycerol-3-phosphate acyltransferase